MNAALNQKPRFTVKLTVFPYGKATMGDFEECSVRRLDELLATEHPWSSWDKDVVKGEKLAMPLIRPAKYDGNSRAAGSPPPAEHYGLMLDVDHTSVPMTDAAQILVEKGIRFYAYETWQHSDKHPRYRILLPFDQPRDAKTTSDLHRVAANTLPDIAPESKDNRGFFIGTPKGHPRASLVGGGAGFDTWGVEESERIAKKAATWEERVAQSKPAKLEGGPFSLEASRAEVLRTGKGTYHHLMRYIHSLAMTGRTEDAIIAAVQAEEEGHFPGYFDDLQANDKTKYKDLERALNGSLKKAALKGVAPTVSVTEPRRIVRIKASDLAGKTPQPPRYIGHGWWPAHVTTLLSGHGGTGKSYFALATAIHAALGRPFLGAPMEKQRVLYFHCEDPTDVVHYRLAKLLRHFKLSMADLTDLELVDGTRGSNAFYVEAREQATRLTQVYMVVRQELADHPVDALVLDGASDFYLANENDRGAVKDFINALNDFGTTNLLLAHVNKETAKAGKAKEAYSGSTGWHNSVRSRLALVQEVSGDKDQVEGNTVLVVQKNNWARAGMESIVAWSDDAECFTFTDFQSRASRLEAQVFDVLKAFARLEQGGVQLFASPNASPNARSLTKLKIAAPQFKNILETLLVDGFVEKFDGVKSNREKTALLRLTKLGWDVVTALTTEEGKF